MLPCDMFACAHVNAKSHNLTKRAARKKAFSKGEKVPAKQGDEDALILMNIYIREYCFVMKYW